MKPDWAQGPEWEWWVWSERRRGFVLWPFANKWEASISPFFGLWIMKHHARVESGGLWLSKVSIHLSPDAARKAAEALLEAGE